MSHTPGPWRVEEIDGKFGQKYGCVWFGGNKQNVCTARMEIDDARLIAAAPDLLAALQELSHHCELDHDILPPDAGLLKTVRAAIAKATGEP